MITVKMVRDNGFKFVEGDVVKGNISGHVAIVSDNGIIINDVSGISDPFEVEEFAWRESKGVIPCDGELLVDIVAPGRKQETTKAKYIWWDLWRGIKWRPSMKNWENEKIKSEVKNLNLVVRLENFAQVDAINQIWRNSNIEPDRSSCMDGFIGGVTSFPIIAYFDFELLEHDTSCGYDYAEGSKYSQSAISFNEFLGVIANHEKFNKTDSKPEWKCGDLCRIDGAVCQDGDESVDNETSSDIEWTTELLPPVGAKCAYFVANMKDYPAKNHMRPMTCVAHVGGHDGLVDNGLAVLVSDDFSFSTVCNERWIRKLETPEQREERESLKLAYELYCAGANRIDEAISLDGFIAAKTLSAMYLAIAKRAKELLVK